MSLLRSALALVAAGALFASSTALTSCVLDFNGLSGGCRGPCADASDGGQAQTDGASDARAPGDGAASAPCPGTAGPIAVRIDAGASSFCIDSTEVTNAQYAAFLAAKGSDVSGQAPPCTDNTTYTPSSGWPGAPGYPVVAVDWCDAVAFCAWAGKRLCGDVGGGSGVEATSNTPSSMWFFACTGGDATRAYPYGSTFDPAACATSGSATPAGSLPTCAGGVGGLFDMSGNVEEWVDECANGGADCLARGGDFGDKSDALTCATHAVKLEPRMLAEDVRGFRCCSP